MHRTTSTLLLVLTLQLSSAYAQDLSGLLDDFDEEETVGSPVEKTFRTPRIINMHSVENPAPKELIFNIGHRFGNLNSGIYDFFGLDYANMRLGFDYGITPWLGVGIGRSTFQKTYDAFAKLRVIGQEGTLGSPITLSYYISASQSTLRDIFPADYDNFSGRLSIANSLLIARKFHDRFSLQLNPIWLRSNYLLETQRSADDVSLGMAARVRVLRRVHVNMEYIHEIVDDGVDDYNPLSFGFDIETGGHVFQLFLSNTQGIFDKAYLTNTRDTWRNGGIYFGFNITRVFYFK